MKRRMRTRCGLVDRGLLGQTGAGATFPAPMRSVLTDAGRSYWAAGGAHLHCLQLAAKAALPVRGTGAGGRGRRHISSRLAGNHVSGEREECLRRASVDSTHLVGGGLAGGETGPALAR
jgi:hypothetical protein